MLPNQNNSSDLHIFIPSVGDSKIIGICESWFVRVRHLSGTLQFVPLFTLVAGCVDSSWDALSYSCPSGWINQYISNYKADLIGVLIRVRVFFGSVLDFCDCYRFSELYGDFAARSCQTRLPTCFLHLWKSQNRLHECKWLIVRSHVSVSVPLSGHSESEEERWRVSCPEHWPRSVLWSWPIQASGALSKRNGSSLPLCVTRLDWNVVIGESWDPHSPCGDVRAKLSINSFTVQQVVTWETGQLLIQTFKNIHLCVHSGAVCSLSDSLPFTCAGSFSFKTNKSQLHLKSNTEL